ncbi:hypothetical protein DEW08_20560 [Azospirillum thermophilum]|uniref:HAMP domain-containing protein n=2 Tax=Azospirillum thermophilum TaxID=2202148 RepID=A0A2S2CVF7_9PROT|nr:hypothetical protein DEW08_20560 [Azospirillum thermophilum]
MLFVILAMVPIAAMETYNQVSIRQIRVKEVRQQVLNLATLIDAAQDQIIQGAEQALGILRTLPIIRSGNFAACQTVLTQAKRGFPGYLQIQATDADGVIRCATDAASVGISIADRPHVRAALQSGDFTVGAYIRVRTTGEPALPFAIRYEGTDGRPGLVTAYLSLGWLSEFLRTRPLPNDAVVDIADGDGVLLARLPESPGLVGTRLPDHYIAMIRAAEAGTTELAGLDGVRRLFGYVPLASGAEGLFVAVGLDEEAVLAPVDEAAIRFAVLTAILAVAGLLLVWRDMQRQIAEPVAALVAATARWRRGDHSARAGLTGGSTEMIAVGQAFDALAEDLETEARIRKEAETALRLSEARLRSIVDTAVDAFVIINDRG